MLVIPLTAIKSAWFMDTFNLKHHIPVDSEEALKRQIMNQGKTTGDTLTVTPAVACVYVPICSSACTPLATLA